MDLWIPFYDQIFDYFSTYSWLYHPCDPYHSAMPVGQVNWVNLGLDRLTPDNDLFDPMFPENNKTCILVGSLWTP